MKKASLLSRFGRMFLSWRRTTAQLAYPKTYAPAKFGQLTSSRILPTICRGSLLFGLLPGIKVAFCAKDLTEKSRLLGSSLKDEEILRVADMYYEKNQMQELFDLLAASKDSTNPELIWRLARATYELAKASTKDEEKKKLTYEAFALSERALDLDEKNFACHKWYAILLDEIGKYEGVKYRLKRSPEVKEHFERSIELNSSDPTSHHCLGYWHYSFADLAWYQRKAAEAFFASPPKSTYEEAVKSFERAEQVQPNFYSMNLLMLGKSYMKLGNYQQAGIYLTKLKDFKAKTAEDEKAKKEGAHLFEEAAVRIRHS